MNVKKCIVIAIFGTLLCSLPDHLFAQAEKEHSEEHPRFKFGLFVAPAVNWMRFKTDGIDSRGAVMNVNYGLTTDFALKGSNKYFISTGLQIMSSGGSYHYVGVANDNDVLVRSDNYIDLTKKYLEIPLGFKLRSDEIGYSIFAGWFGFGTGFRLNAFQDRQTEWNSSTGRKMEMHQGENVNDQFQPVRLSLMIGFEWERQISKETFFTFGFMYSNGLSNVFDQKGYNTDSEGALDWTSVNPDGSPNGDKLKANSRSFSLNFGIYF